MPYTEREATATRCHKGANHRGRAAIHAREEQQSRDQYLSRVIKTCKAFG